MPARSPQVPVSWLEHPPQHAWGCVMPPHPPRGAAGAAPARLGARHHCRVQPGPAWPWSLKLGSLPVWGMGRGLIEEMLTMVMLTMLTMLMPHSAPSRLNEFTKHISGEGCKCARIRLRGGAGSASPPAVCRDTLGSQGVPDG